MKIKDKLNRYETALEAILCHKECKGEYPPKDCLKVILETAENALDTEKEEG